MEGRVRGSPTLLLCKDVMVCDPGQTGRHHGYAKSHEDRIKGNFCLLVDFTVLLGGHPVQKPAPVNKSLASSTDL